MTLRGQTQQVRGLGVRKALLGFGAVATLIVIACWPVTTHVGINYQVSSTRIPLYEKAINFLSRDLQTRRLAKEIVAGSQSDEEKLLRIFAWVTQHIRPTPKGFPIIDDHPLHILIRGYGAGDQRTEAFILLAGYTGYPGVVAELKPAGALRGHLVALVRAGFSTLLFDVLNQVVFRNEHGALADVQEVLKDPALIEKAASGLTIDGLAYGQYILELDHVKRAFSRTESQKLWPRLVQEVSRWLGIDRLLSHDRLKL